MKPHRSVTNIHTLYLIVECLFSISKGQSTGQLYYAQLYESTYLNKVELFDRCE